MELPAPILSTKPFVALSLAPNRGNRRWQFNRPLEALAFIVLLSSVPFAIAFGLGFWFCFSVSRFSSLFSYFFLFCLCFLGKKIGGVFSSLLKVARWRRLARFQEPYSQVFFFSTGLQWPLNLTPIQYNTPPVPSAKQPTHHHDHLEWLLRGGSNIQHSNGHFYDRRSIVLVNRETFKLPINQCGFHVDQLWVHLPNSAFNKMLIRCTFKLIPWLYKVLRFRSAF